MKKLMRLGCLFLCILAIVIGCRNPTPLAVSTTVSPISSLVISLLTPEKEAKGFTISEPLAVILIDEKTLGAIGIVNFGVPLRGFYQPSERLIVVRYSDEKDKNGNYLPDFEALGHEFYHVLAGAFHE